MNANIKQSIIDTARQLFNEKGFHDTSMRDIAAALHISVGNLTYHYKKKEDLIEAIALQDHQKYRKPDLLRSFGDLQELFEKNISVRNSRPYYFRHYVQLSQLCPAIYEMQVSVLKDLNDVLTRSFGGFVEKGLLKEEFSKEYDGIIAAMMTMMVYGLPDFCRIREDGPALRPSDCVWSMLIPCMTSQGLTEYHLLLDRGQQT